LGKDVIPLRAVHTAAKAPHKVHAHWQHAKVRNGVLYALPNLASLHIKCIEVPFPAGSGNEHPQMK
jgi:hypothetical protein